MVNKSKLKLQRLRRIKRPLKFRAQKLSKIRKLQTENARLRAELGRLRGLGLYTGKVSKRRTRPTSYQERVIRQFQDVLRGRATAVRPKNPRSYDRIFKRRGKVVVVPRGKGERIKINKRGNIVRIRKGPRGETITGTLKRQNMREAPTRPKGAVVYAIPFARKLGQNKYKLEWVRFPNFDTLQKFMQEYEKMDERGRVRYGDWPDYVLEERISGADIETRNARLTRRAISSGMTSSANEFEATEELTLLGRRNRRRVARKKFRKANASGRNDES